MPIKLHQYKYYKIDKISKYKIGKYKKSKDKINKH